MRFMLDTHAWFWCLENWEKIPANAGGVLKEPGNRPFALSSISFWELSKLVEKKRITLTVALDDWMETALNPRFIKVVPISREVAIESTSLPDGFHDDPADQLIAATARVHNLTLITADRKIQSYGHVRTLWN